MILGPDNRRAALRVDAQGRLLTTAGAGATGTIAYAGVWANRPAANSVGPGTKIIVTDIGASGYSEWFSDGAYWKPVGPVTLFSDFVITDPTTTSLASLAGNSTEQFFVLPKGAQLIPGGLAQFPGGVIEIQAHFRKAGGIAASGNCRAYLSLDSAYAVGRNCIVVQQPCGTTDGGAINPAGRVMFNETTGRVYGQRLPVGGNFNTTNWHSDSDVTCDLPLYVNFGIQETWTADTCHLLGYRVTLLGG
jgi:hypothetical protein